MVASVSLVTSSNAACKPASSAASTAPAISPTTPESLESASINATVSTSSLRSSEPMSVSTGVEYASAVASCRCSVLSRRAFFAGWSGTTKPASPAEWTRLPVSSDRSGVASVDVAASFFAFWLFRLIRLAAARLITDSVLGILQRRQLRNGTSNVTTYTRKVCSRYPPVPLVDMVGCVRPGKTWYRRMKLSVRLGARYSGRERIPLRVCARTGWNCE